MRFTFYGVSLCTTFVTSLGLVEGRNSFGSWRHAIVGHIAAHMKVLVTVDGDQRVAESDLELC